MRDGEHQAQGTPSGLPAPVWAPPGAKPPELTPAHLVALLAHVDRALKLEGIDANTRRRVIRTVLYGTPERRTTAPVVCPRCAAVSYHPRDVAEGYCSRCSWWTSSPDLSTPTGHPRVDAPNDD